MTVKALPERVHYSAYNTVTSKFIQDDEANHTLTFRRDATTFIPTNPPAHIANGVYEVVLTDPERVGEVLVITGSSSTADVIIQPIGQAAEPRLAGMTKADTDDPSIATYTLAAHSDLADQIAAGQTAIIDTGNSNWLTASGFATPSDVAGVITHGGDGPWTSGAASTGDWTDAEKKQFRYQLGIDGVTEEPSTNIPNLSTFNPATDQVLADLVAILGSSQRANQHAINIDTLVPTVVDDAQLPPSTVEFDTPLTEPATDHYKNRAVIFTSGPNAKSASIITGYLFVNGKGRITVAGFPQSPGSGDTLIIV